MGECVSPYLTVAIPYSSRYSRLHHSLNHPRPDPFWLTYLGAKQDFALTVCFDAGLKVCLNLDYSVYLQEDY